MNGNYLNRYTTFKDISLYLSIISSNYLNLNVTRSIPIGILDIVASFIDLISKQSPRLWTLTAINFWKSWPTCWSWISRVQSVFAIFPYVCLDYGENEPIAKGVAVMENNDQMYPIEGVLQKIN